MLPVLSAIPFVHPVLAGAAVATGLIPVIIHLINRRRYRRVRWAAMSFLRAAQRYSARQIALQHWLLLATRVVLVVLLGLAVARPFVPITSRVAGQTSPAHRVILLDDSLAMNARDGAGRTRFEKALDYAEQLVAALPAHDAVSVVAMSNAADEVVAHAAMDRRSVRERLAAMSPTQRMPDAVAAMERAREILGASELPPGNRTVHVISSFSRRDWEDGDSSEPTAAVLAARRLADALDDSEVDLSFVHIGPGEVENAAVTRLEIESPLVAVQIPVRIATEVANLGSTALRSANLEVRHDGEVVRREPLGLIEPGRSVVTTFAVGLTRIGTHIVDVQLVLAAPDAFADDNIRYLSIDVREAIPVLLVDGRPGGTALAGEAGYLAAALTPSVRGSSSRGLGAAVRNDRAPVTPVKTRIVNPLELPSEPLPEYDVIAMCNVSRLPQDQWRRLEDYVSRGGGLLLFAGDLVDVADYNRLAYAKGAGLLPGTLGRGEVPSAAESGPTGFDPQGLSHGIVAEFAEHPESGLFLARVDEHLPFEPAGSRGQVVLRYLDGDPALIVSEFGEGRVMVCTTSANMAWNNLPAKGDYVSLMVNAVAYLARNHGDHRNVFVGGALVEPLTPGQSSMPLSVRTSDGRKLDGRVRATGSKLSCVHEPVERSGPHVIAVGPTVRSFAVNLDPQGANLAGVDADALRKALDRPARVITDGEAGASESALVKATELALPGLFVVLLLLLVEMWLAMRFGAKHVGAS